MNCSYRRSPALDRVSRITRVFVAITKKGRNKAAMASCHNMTTKTY
eukprot:gene14226-4181_t